MGQLGKVLGLALPPQPRRRRFSGVSWVGARGGSERKGARRGRGQGLGAQPGALGEPGAHWVLVPQWNLEKEAQGRERVSFLAQHHETEIR